MGNAYLRRRAVVCYPCDMKEGVVEMRGGIGMDQAHMHHHAHHHHHGGSAPHEEHTLTLEDFLGSEFMDFHFIQDPETVDYIKANKVLFVLRGLPGSGKSYITRVLLSLYPDSVAFTADTYLLRHPEMILNPRVLDEAHRHCLNAVGKVVRMGQSPIIVDNTNVTRNEVKQYLRLARSFGYFGLIVEPKTPWRFTPPTLTAKTGRKVELAVVQNRLNTWQDMIPVAYACYLNVIDSKLLYNVAESLLSKVLKSDLVMDDFSKSNGKPVSGKAALAYFTKHRGCENNLLKWVVARGSDLTPEGYYSVGKILHFKVTAFLLTPKYVGAKIVPGKVKVLSHDPEAETSRDSAVITLFSASSWENTLEILEPLSDLESQYEAKELPGTVEDISYGVKIVRLEPYAFAFYAGRSYEFKGLFSGCYS